jgi:hypothetical protein
MDEQFKIKSYAYCELALLYFPNSTKKSASTQLGRWLRNSELLKKQLREIGFKSRCKILTPSQVKLITDFFGKP